MLWITAVESYSQIIDITISLGQEVGLPIGDTTMNVSIYKDNSGALILDQVYHHNLICRANTMPPKPFGLVKR